MAGHKLPTELSRDLNLFQITMMGLGMMIGAGVFLGIGNAVFESGPGGVLLTFLLNGIIALFTAFSYAELSSAIPHTGGAYNYARIGFGKGPSFIAGWMEWFASSVAGSLYSVTFGIYVGRYLSILGVLDWVPLDIAVIEKILALIVAVFFLFINYRGASETGKVGALFTLGQTLFLVIIGVVGVVIVIREPERLMNFEPFLPHGWSKLLVTMGFTYVAFEGYEVIAQTGDEVENPRSNLPKAMLYSVFIVTLTYVLVAFATVVAVKHGQHGIEVPVWEWIGSHHERGFGEAVAKLMPAGNFLLTLAVIFAATSALNSTIYSATRALYALGRDNMVPLVISKISEKTKTPWVALMMTGTLIIIVAVFLPTMDVASSASMMFLVLFFLVNICVIRVRVHLGDELKYGFVMPMFPLFPILALIIQAILAAWLIHMSLIAWVVVPSWIVTGVIIYLSYSRHHVKLQAHDIQIVEDTPSDQAIGNDGYRIMVAVANPDNAIEMIHATSHLSRAKDASVDLLHMVPVPDQMPLADAESYMWEGREAIVEAMLYLEPLSPVNSTIRYCRNIARGIVSAVKEKRINTLIMGWNGKEKKQLFNLGSTVDPILERSPSNVLILKGRMKHSYSRILVPVAGGPNSALSLEIASLFLKPAEGKITLLSVARGKNPFDIFAFAEEQTKRLELDPSCIDIQERNASDVEKEILEASADHELLVMGGTRKRMIQQVSSDPLPERVAKSCGIPLIMVHASHGVSSWLKRWL